MSNRAELEAALWSILDVLRSYSEDVLLIGGWVPYFHLRYGRAAEDGARTSLTAEADLVVPRRLPSGERPPVAEILEAAGYHRVPTAAAVWEKAPQNGKRIEFFQMHRGPALRLGTTRPVEGQPGLRALSLDHLWVLEAFTDFVRARTALNADLDVMLGSEESRSVRDYIRRGVVHLRNIAPRFHASSGEMLSERDGVEATAARADVQGQLTDLIELLEARVR